MAGSKDPAGSGISGSHIPSITFEGDERSASNQRLDMNVNVRTWSEFNLRRRKHLTDLPLRARSGQSDQGERKKDQPFHSETSALHGRRRRST
jgi:hypothetical protein